MLAKVAAFLAMERSTRSIRVHRSSQDRDVGLVPDVTLPTCASGMQDPCLGFEARFDSGRGRCLKPSNRERTLAAVHAPSWCDNCDGALVSAGYRCPRCRHLQGGQKRYSIRDARKLVVDRDD